MAHTFTHMMAHIIFSTKDRAPLLDAELKPRVCAYLGGIARELKAIPAAINGMLDHVHMMTTIPSTMAVADFLRTLKTNSSRWVHQEFPRLSGFAWQTGYGAFSVSRSNEPDVERYITDQESHHQHVTFQEEFIAFLKKHNISYDERYIWE